jgi:hypothetical protein
MKTPRELLLERHRAAGPKLDAIRQATLAGLKPAPGRSSAADRISLWELVRSLRWHLAGMSAVWLAVAALNFDLPSASQPGLARHSTVSPGQLLMSLLENRRRIQEMLETPAPKPVPEPRASMPQLHGLLVRPEMMV